MGIQGLIPFLKNATRPGSIREFKGCTVAIDSYCWLHRGAFACAEKLAMGEKTDQYVFYCMKFINSLLAMGVKPIMVFDGCRLPSKLEVEKGRRERREANRHKAAQLLREGKRSEARDCLAQCIDITSDMALDLMKACREKGVDCIVAPYEADAQLAYLSNADIAHVIITEDSDLVLFGCERVMFKMDVTGNGLLYERKNLNKALGAHPEHFTFDRFRYMCILSGCDYLSNLPGIGLGKALKVFKKSHQPDVKLILKKLPSLLNMSSLVVPPQYIESFVRADHCFLYQLIFDPLTRTIKPFSPYPSDLDPKQLSYAGPMMSNEKAYQIALGNINVNTGEVIFDFDPDNFTCKTQGWNDSATAAQKSSIWSRDFKPRRFTQYTGDNDVNEESNRTTATKGREVVVKAPVFRTKRLRDEDADVCDDELGKIYSNNSDNNSDTITSPSSRQRIAAVGAYVDKLFPKSSPGDNKRSLFSQLESDKVPEENARHSQNYSPIKADIITNNDDENENFALKHELMDELVNSYVSPRKPLSPANQGDIHVRPSPGKYHGKENEGTSTSTTHAEDQEEILTSPNAKKKNVFAVSSGKASKFSLNALKCKTATVVPDLITTKNVEVRSRFLTMKKPKKESEFFKELKESCSDATSVQNIVDVRGTANMNVNMAAEVKQDDRIEPETALPMMEFEESETGDLKSSASSNFSPQQSNSRPSPNFTKLSAFRSGWKNGPQITNHLDNDDDDFRTKNSAKKTKSVNTVFKPVKSKNTPAENRNKLTSMFSAVPRQSSKNLYSVHECESPIPSRKTPERSNSVIKKSHLNESVISGDLFTDCSKNSSTIELDSVNRSTRLNESQGSMCEDDDEAPLPFLNYSDTGEDPLYRPISHPKSNFSSVDLKSASKSRRNSVNVEEQGATGRPHRNSLNNEEQAAEPTLLDRILTIPSDETSVTYNFVELSRTENRNKILQTNKPKSRHSTGSTDEMIGWLAEGKAGSSKTSSRPSDKPFVKDRPLMGGCRTSGLSRKTKTKNSSDGQQSSISSFLHSNFSYTASSRSLYNE